MHLQKLLISNFKAIDQVEVEFDNLVTVIIGPNAVGKTTILEAIRLAKSLLAPRTQTESAQTLYNLGLVSPHMPQRFLPQAITSNTTRPLLVKCAFKLTSDELAKIEAFLPQMASNFALQSAGLNFSNPAQAMGYLNSSLGQQAVKHSNTQLVTEFSSVKIKKIIELNLTIDFATSNIAGEFPIHQVFYSAIEQNLNPSETLFSYFPADRAMPVGEQAVQLGIADTNQQLESYNSQPQLKYNRLKNMIFNSIIGGKDGRSLLRGQFDLIFEKILKGRTLGDIGVNELGMLSIPIIDTETKAKFEIDGLSSGEKGLILTCLLIAQSIANNGLILLDEPELHLNPAACRDLLQFFVDEYAIKKNMQAIICSHSAEILAGALDRSDCALFHLKSGSSLTKVRQHDQGEIRDALRRLGSSESEALLYRGTISVEGIHDVEILQIGFDDTIRRYKLKQLGGRGTVETDIKELQKAEKKGDEIGTHYFLFDLDRKPTSLKDSPHVKLRQLKRYCLENYLLDIEIITDLTRDRDFSNRPINNIAETSEKMKSLAMKQLNDVAARDVFVHLGLQSVGFDMKVLDSDDSKAIAVSLWSQVEGIKNRFQELADLNFKAEFERLFAEKFSELKPVWNEKWRELCNGKKLLEDMRQDGIFHGDLLRHKRRIISEMRIKQTETWSSLKDILQDLVST